MDLPRCRLARWSDVDRWTDSLVRKIRTAPELPDVLVALTRGGWVPARLLADRLGIRHLAAVRVQHWGVTATPSGKAEITEGLATPLSGRRVLVVDDITDTGQSLELAVRHVHAAGPSHVESATYLHIQHSQYTPTYYAEEIPRDAWVWIVFPWNYWEDVRTLARKALPEGGNGEGVRRILRDRCSLEVPSADVERALAEAPDAPVA